MFSGDGHNLMAVSPAADVALALFEGPAGADLGFGRIVASEIEVANMLVNMV